MRFSTPKMHEIQSFPGPRSDPTAGVYSAPPDPLASGEGARCSLSKNPSPLSALRASHSAHLQSISRRRFLFQCYDLHLSLVLLGLRSVLIDKLYLVTNTTIAYAETTGVWQLVCRAWTRAIHPYHAVLSRSASVADAAAATNDTTLFADQMNAVNHSIKTSQAGQHSLAA